MRYLKSINEFWDMEYLNSLNPFKKKEKPEEKPAVKNPEIKKSEKPAVEMPEDDWADMFAKSFNTETPKEPEVPKEPDPVYTEKVLFLQFGLKIDTHGEPDEQNFFRGCNDMPSLFKTLMKEKSPSTEVLFKSYSDIYRVRDGFYYEDTNLKEFDFVFFGFISKHGALPLLVQDYLKKHNVPFLTYESFGLYDSKTWGMELTESLGYPYIPSVVTSTLNRRVLEEVKEWGFPVIVKDPTLDRGLGVFKIDDEKELKAKFRWNSTPFMIQKMIRNDGDFRVITMKNKMELLIKRQVTSDTEFRSNVALGGKAVKASLPPEIVAMCEDISRHVNCDIIGFDVLQDLDTGEYYIMEINISPHFSTFCVVSGVNLPEIICNYILEEIN